MYFLKCMAQRSTHNVDPVIWYRMHDSGLLGHRSYGIPVIPALQHMCIGPCTLRPGLRCREYERCSIAQEGFPLEDIPNRCNIHHQPRYTLILVLKQVSKYVFSINPDSQIVSTFFQKHTKWKGKFLPQLFQKKFQSLLPQSQDLSLHAFGFFFK